MDPDLNIVLVEPEIPQNTGAVGRLCVTVDARLHLIQPIGFSIADSKVRRCGLDYWRHLDLRVHRCWAEFVDSERPSNLYFATARAARTIYACRVASPAYLVFGSESRGLSPEFHLDHAERLWRIPMPGPRARSLNLAAAVAVFAYEALRQIGRVGSDPGSVPAPDNSRPTDCLPSRGA